MMARQFHFSITSVNGLIQAAPLKAAIAADDLPATGVTPGTYTAATITVDAQGRLTAASSGTPTAPGGSSGQLQYNNAGAFDGVAGGIANTSGYIGINTTDLTELVPGTGTLAFAVGNGLGSRFGYQTTFGGFLAVVGNGVTAYVANPVSDEGLVLGSYSDHPVTVRVTNITHAQFLATTGRFWVGSYNINTTVAATHQMTAALSNASTSVVNDVICCRFDGAAGAASAGIGAGLAFRVNSSTTFAVDCAQVAGGWSTVTHASRKGFLTLSAYDTAIREGIRVQASGSAAMLGFYGATAIVKPSGDVATALSDLGLITSPTIPGIAEGDSPTWTGIHTWTPAARTSGSAAYFTVNAPADTGLTASTEAIGINHVGATRQHATGAITLQREYVFGAPTYSFVGASTITTAVGVEFASPIAGTNATLTKSVAGRFVASTAAHVPLVAKAAGSPTGSLFETQDSTNAVQTYIDSNFNLQFPHTKGVFGVGGGQFKIFEGASGGGTGNITMSASTLVFQSAAITTMTVNNNQTVTITCGTAAAVALGVKGAASQTGSLVQLYGVSSTTTREQVDIDTAWATSTDASRKARGVFRVWDTAVREGFRIEASGSAPMIGFLGASAVVRQASAADLTNNVTSGGTDDTIADFTDLTLYVNDAATIRNDIYQLARKVKQINDALRLYGLLT